MRLFVPKRTDDDIAALRTIIRDFRQAAQQPRAAGDVLEDFLYFVTQRDAEGAIALFDTNTDEFVSRLVDA